MALLRAAFPPLESEHFQHFCFLPVCHFQAQHFIGSSGENCITVRFAFSCQDACEAVVLAEAKPKGLLSAAAAFSAPSPQRRDFTPSGFTPILSQFVENTDFTNFVLRSDHQMKAHHRQRSSPRWSRGSVPARGAPAVPLRRPQDPGNPGSVSQTPLVRLQPGLPSAVLTRLGESRAASGCRTGTGLPRCSLLQAERGGAGAVRGARAGGAAAAAVLAGRGRCCPAAARLWARSLPPRFHWSSRRQVGAILKPTGGPGRAAEGEGVRGDWLRRRRQLLSEPGAAAARSGPAWDQRREAVAAG